VGSAVYVRGGSLQRWLAAIATAICLAWTNRLLMLRVSGRLPLDGPTPNACAARSA
jgi:hypothetical protein